MDKKLATLLSLVLSLMLLSGSAIADEENRVVKEPPEGDTLFNPPAANEPVIEEGEGIEPSFAEVDTDGDGRISEEEAADYEAVADNFKFVDEDNDGYLSDVEFMDLKE